MTVATQPVSNDAGPAPAQRLHSSSAAMRLSFTWFGVRKTLTPQQKAQAAEPFGAQSNFLSAGKKLIDTKHPVFKAVTTVRSGVQSVLDGLLVDRPRRRIMRPAPREAS